MDKLKFFFSELAHNFRYNEFLRKNFTHGALLGTFASILIHAPVLLTYHFYLNYPQNYRPPEDILIALISIFTTAFGFMEMYLSKRSFFTKLVALSSFYISGIYLCIHMFYVDPHMSNDLSLTLFLVTLIRFIAMLIAERKENKRSLT